MIRHLILAVLLAGLALAMFAERLGLPVAMAQQSVLVLSAVSLALLVITAATSRLTSFLSSARADIISAACLHALHIGVAVFWLAGLQPLSLIGLAAMIASFLAGLLFLPSFGIDPRSATLVVPALDKDEGHLFVFGIGGLALATLFAIFPSLVTQPETTLGAPFLIRPELALIVIVSAILLGGAGALTVMALALLFLACLFASLPAVMIALKDLPDLRGLLNDPGIRAVDWWTMLPILSPSPLQQLIMPVLAGLGAALLSAPQQARIASRWSRAGAAGLATLLAAAIAGITMAIDARFSDIVANEIIGQPPARWPVFTFDDGLRGWLWLCGRAPIDALDVVQACRNAGLVLPPSRGDLTLDPGLKPMAVAAALQLPHIMGVVWVIIAQLGMLIALALLLFRASMAISEIVLHRLLRPRSLKAGRLIGARLTILVVSSVLWLLHRGGFVEARFLQFLAIGMLILIAFVLIGAMTRRAVRALNRYRTRRRLALPMPDSATLLPLPA